MGTRPKFFGGQQSENVNHPSPIVWAEDAVIQGSSPYSTKGELVLGLYRVQLATWATISAGAVVVGLVSGFWVYLGAIKCKF